jgi:hypothetical protein
LGGANLFCKELPPLDFCELSWDIIGNYIDELRPLLMGRNNVLPIVDELLLCIFCFIWNKFCPSPVSSSSWMVCIPFFKERIEELSFNN